MAVSLNLQHAWLRCSASDRCGPAVDEAALAGNHTCGAAPRLGLGMPVRVRASGAVRLLLQQCAWLRASARCKMRVFAVPPWHACPCGPLALGRACCTPASAMIPPERPSAPHPGSARRRGQADRMRGGLRLWRQLAQGGVGQRGRGRACGAMHGAVLAECGRSSQSGSAAVRSSRRSLDPEHVSSKLVPKAALSRRSCMPRRWIIGPGAGLGDRGSWAGAPALQSLFRGPCQACSSAPAGRRRTSGSGWRSCRALQKRRRS